MDDVMLAAPILEELKRVETPTVSNTIEEAQGKHGFDNFRKRKMLVPDITAPAMVGCARTAKRAADAARNNRETERRMGTI